MTTEQKARRYDEALRIARNVWRFSSNNAEIMRMEELFPELKESEGEKIRKDLKRAISVALDYSYFDKETVNNCIAWLEKQDKFIENNEDDSDTDFTIYHPLKNSKGHYECIPYSFYGTLSSFSEDKDMIDFLRLCFYTEEECNEWIKQNESTDTLEHKFNVGDWVTTDKGDIIQITAANPGYYIIDNGMEFSTSYVDKYWHLWTIQDAKDGDVLSNGQMIVIFKHFEEPAYRQHIVAYVGLDINGNIQITDDTWNFGIDKAKPATKEQCNILFAKMTEEGYEWSEDTHELKKISQRTISAEAKEALWSDKYKGLTDFERTLADICIGWIGEEPGWKQYIKDNADVLLKIAIEKFNSVQDTLFKQKPDWSEEDEKILNNLIDYIKVDDALQYSEKQVVDWLKSLKNRVISQPDMVEALRTEYEKGRADTIAEMYVPTQISPEESLGVSSEKYMDIVDTLTQGGQKPAKWSLEDERVIAIINNALTESNTQPDDYDKVYDWLESLKQRIKSYE